MVYRTPNINKLKSLISNKVKECTWDGDTIQPLNSKFICLSFRENAFGPIVIVKTFLSCELDILMSVGLSTNISSPFIVRELG